MVLYRNVDLVDASKALALDDVDHLFVAVVRTLPDDAARHEGLPTPAALLQLEAVRQRIAVIDVNRIVPSDPRPTGYARHDRGTITDLRCRFDLAVEQSPDDAFVGEFCTDRQPASCHELSHSCRRPCPAG